MHFFIFWGRLTLFLMCLGSIAIGSEIVSDNAAGLDGNLIASGILEGGETVQVPDLQPDPTPLLIAGQSEYCNPTKRRSRLKRDQTTCESQQFRVNPPKTGNLLSPSSEMKTSPVTPTTPETQTEEPMSDIQTLMKLSDEEKCFQYEKMKTPVCSPGFPTYTSPAITVFPVHESVTGDPCLPQEDLWCCELAVPMSSQALQTWYRIVGDRYKDTGSTCVRYDYLPASSEQQGSVGHGSLGTDRNGFWMMVHNLPDSYRKLSCPLREASFSSL